MASRKIVIFTLIFSVAGFWGHTQAGNKHIATVKTVDQQFKLVELVLINKDVVRIRADYMREGGLDLKREEVERIVFPGGRDDAKGIVLRNGLSLNGYIIEYSTNKWRIQVDGLQGDFTLLNTDVLSVNFRDKALIVPRTGAENWKYNAAVNVLEWIYDNDQTVLGEKVPYKLDIQKLALTANKIHLEAFIYSETFSDNRCNIECILRDEKRNTYDKKVTAIGHIPAKAGKRKLAINCPIPKGNAEIITIALRNTWGGCGDTGWHELAAFDMKVLK